MWSPVRRGGTCLDYLMNYQGALWFSFSLGDLDWDARWFMIGWYGLHK